MHFKEKAKISFRNFSRENYNLHSMDANFDEKETYSFRILCEVMNKFVTNWAQSITSSSRRRLNLTEHSFTDCSALYRIPLELLKNMNQHNETLFFRACF